MLNYIYLLPARQMRILHTQTYIGNLLQIQGLPKNEASSFFPAPVKCSVSEQPKITLTEVSRNRNPLQIMFVLGG